MRQLRKKEVKKKYKSFPKREHQIVLVLENIEYARNVASIFRTAEAAGVKKIILSGISKVPPFGKEMRQVSRNKEQSLPWEYIENTSEALSKLIKDDFYICAIELTDISIPVSQLKETLKKHKRIAFVAGSEVFGIKKTTLEKCNTSVEIPMYGKMSSLNVSVSVGIALFSF